MNKSSGMRRRDILHIGALGVSGAAAAALAGCGETQVVEVVKEVPVEKVKEIVKEVPIEREKIVTKIVERIVTQDAPPQLKRVDLTLLYNQFGTPEMWRAVFKKLEQEKPHLVVRETAVPYPGTEQKVLTALAGGVDLDMASVIHQWLGTFGEKEAVVPLEPLMKRDGLDPEKWYASALLDATHRGTLIGLPYYFGPIMEFLNMDLFEASGLEHPGKLPRPNGTSTPTLSMRRHSPRGKEWTRYTGSAASRSPTRSSCPCTSGRSAATSGPTTSQEASSIHQSGWRRCSGWPKP